MKKRKNIITVAIDSPAAAGAGTQAKLIAQAYNLIYLDTGKIYRYIGWLRLSKNKSFSLLFIKKKIKKLRINELQNKKLLSDKVALSASIIAKDKKIRNIIKEFQLNIAYKPPQKFSGSVLDGRDITSIIMKDAMFKFFINANLNIRAKRRYLEYKKLKNKITFKEVLKNLKKRDKFDKNRRYSPLVKTEDSILINTSKLSKKACFYKIKAIMDKKL